MIKKWRTRECLREGKKSWQSFRRQSLIKRTRELREHKIKSKRPKKKKKNCSSTSMTIRRGEEERGSGMTNTSKKL